MVFSSLLFLLLFLPLSLSAYYFVRCLCPKECNTVLLLCSLVFYIWGVCKIVFLGLFFSSIVTDFIVARYIAARNHGLQTKLLLILSIGTNLALLIYYKYANFFIAEVNAILVHAGCRAYSWESVLLPIGISFFVFHKISYVVDVYKRKAQPLKRLGDFTLYLLLFPQLIAGPIVRFHEIADQIQGRNHTVDLFFQGICRFSLGLAKKVLIANSFDPAVTVIFKQPPQALTMEAAWLGAVLYAFQIYFDFSGYSDMAIGLGNMFGFRLPENFNRPYISQSITEFWRRWHMSLSRFFRDYVYIPLGGNRCSVMRHYFNLGLVFFLCGLWHGANWVFVAWGLYHGLLLIADKLFFLRLLAKLPGVFGQTLTFLLVVIGWVFFRSNDLASAGQYLAIMFGWGVCTDFSAVAGYLTNKVYFYAAAAAVISLGSFSTDSMYAKIERLTWAGGVAVLCMFVYCLAVLSTGSFNPFIYFQF